MSQLMLDDQNTMNDINPFTNVDNFFPPVQVNIHSILRNINHQITKKDKKSMLAQLVVFYQRVLVDPATEKKSVLYLDHFFLKEI